MSVASVAGQQAATPTSPASGSTSGGALGSLSGNLDSFLRLLMTQLQNQDPTSPLDSSQFTSQLVQYSSVEQQIQGNTNLTSLIQLTQGNEVVQSANLLGKKVEVASDQLSLQSGDATAKFAVDEAGPVSILVLDGAGHQVSASTVKAEVGSNTFSWDGHDSAGDTLPDGAYQAMIRRDDGAGGSVAVPTTIVGTVTGVDSDGTSVKVKLGDVAVDFSKLRSLRS